MSNIFVAIKLVSASILATLGKHFDVKSQKGVTIIEYALLGALIAAFLVTSITTLRGDIATLFTTLASSI